MKLTDLIAGHIIESIDGQGGTVEIARNELAQIIGCVPSQISYVVTSRFTPENGYIVESRRGGGGYIRISRVSLSGAQHIMHIINSISSSITQREAVGVITSMYDSELIGEETGRAMMAAVSDQSLKKCSTQYRGYLRADIFKQMLISIVTGGV